MIFCGDQASGLVCRKRRGFEVRSETEVRIILVKLCVSSVNLAMWGCWDVGWSGGWVLGRLVLPTSLPRMKPRVHLSDFRKNADSLQPPRWLKFCVR